MTRISLGLVTLLALSTAVSMVSAHEGHHHEEEQKAFTAPDAAIDITEFKVGPTIRVVFFYFFTANMNLTVVKNVPL